jgi:hypothetical protein
MHYPGYSGLAAGVHNHTVTPRGVEGR